MRTFGITLITALLVGGTGAAAAQAVNTIRTFQMNAGDTDVVVWDIPSPESHPVALGVVVRLGKRLHHTRLDCSHLVHRLYQRAGLDYTYVNSTEMYEGVSEFQQVSEPEPGDIVVWEGHMGVVVDPDEHSFLSALRTGVKTSHYDSPYWQRRGRPRFFRYALPVPEPPVHTARNRLPHPSEAE